MKQKLRHLLILGTLVITGQLNAQWTGTEVNAVYHLYAIDAVSDNVIYTGGYGGSMLKTADGGNSWQNLNLGSSDWVSAIEFLDENTGWVCSQPASMMDNGRVQFTADGGNTWTTIENSASYLAMDWLNASVGYVGGWDGFIEKTSDGGNNWTILSIPTLNAISTIEFVNENTGFVVTAQHDFFRTTNGGLTWESFTHAGIETVYFKDALNGFCVDYYGKIGKTNDGGATFTYTLTPYDFQLRDVYFVDDNVGYVVGGLDCSSGNCIQSPALLATSDGGATWINQNHPYIGMDKGFYQIDVTPNGTPYVAGSDKIVLRNITLAGLENSSPLNSLSVFPNPATETIHINIPENGDKLLLINSLGQKLYEASIPQNIDKMTLSLEDFEDGIYYIEIYDIRNDKTGMTKFIKSSKH